MDKEWAKLDRRGEKFQEGARNFVNATRARSADSDMIVCPCLRCRNLQHHHFNTVYEHLVIKGFDPNYKIWVMHGEKPSESNEHDNVETREMHRLYEDLYVQKDEFREQPEVTRETEIDNLVKEAEIPLFSGCIKYTKMSAIITMFKFKASFNITDSACDSMMQMIRDMLPDDNTLPESFYLSKKIFKRFELGYEKIHACSNDCCLFRNELEHTTECPTCGASRWKTNNNGVGSKNGVPAKVLRYFPIIPRLRRMFAIAETAEQLRWHSTNKSIDGKLRHPVDSLAWDLINKRWPSFALDPRNMRFGLSTDGFNPFQDHSTYSCWPVILAPYNLPPWLCMSKENLMLTLLIPGPKQPGNDIDIYLAPLIDDLELLWTNGIEVFDAFSQMSFNLKCILMWTINDFLAYGNLSGWPTKGRFACPVCREDTCSDWLSHSHKFTYMGHRRFLAPDHRFRFKRSWFNGHNEINRRPKISTSEEIYREMGEVVNNWGKMNKKNSKKRKHTDTNSSRDSLWKKKSIFFQLPYWKSLLVRHNLDVMHIEKNICESLFGTLLNQKGKTKDGLNSRKDLEEMQIRRDLHPQKRGNRLYLPAAPHTLSKSEKIFFCQRLYNLKLPDGYGSNIANCVSLEDCKLIGLKSHDCHILMQQLLVVALKGLLPKAPRTAVFRLCVFFNELCQKVLDRNKLEKLEEDIAETLCMLERFFPPSFFDIMVHLTIHLGREARLCGPVQYRWMYPFERYMKVLKGYVKNRARPEGCIAERYIVEECALLCSKYIKKADDVGSRHARNEEFENSLLLEGRLISKGLSIDLLYELLQVAHRYVLFNTQDVQPYIDLHKDELKRVDGRLKRSEALLEKKHIDSFTEWFNTKIREQVDSENISTTLRWLARGPSQRATSYSGIIVNGLRFRTKFKETNTTQNSGVSLEATTICRASARDNAMVKEKVTYYGVLTEIIVLSYSAFEIALFKCDWANTVNGIKVEDGFTLVNLREGQTQFQKDPFILASQAKQVFYSIVDETTSWYTVLHPPPRGSQEWEMCDQIECELSPPIDMSELHNNEDEEEKKEEEEEEYVRLDAEGVLCEP